MGNVIVVYYSYDGSCHRAAEKIKEALHCDLLRLKPVNDMKPAGFSKYVSGAKRVLFEKNPVLEPYDFELGRYDAVIIGSPCWAGKNVPAINTFLQNHTIKGKKVALYCGCMQAEGNTFTSIVKMIPENEFLPSLVLQSPGKKGDAYIDEKVSQWIKEIKDLL